ncbi:aldo/keto reductase [Candidatus Bathyarchaeota archaeon]|nr:aldo/keto reductase [Candidatus Bathyarchaeota archaeon]
MRRGIVTKYRRFGKLNWEVSALGFGAMRLPIIDGDPAKIDQPTAIRMIRYAIDHGVNYVDTAYVYHRGTSETLVGKSLQDGYREKVRLATKMPTWLVNSQQDMDKYLDEQLARLQTDHIDFYLLHGLNKDRWPKVKQLGVIGWAEKKMEEGKIGRLGFSFHDEYSVFKEIIDSYEGCTFCQIQFNYTDADYQAGTKGLKYAASKGLAVVVMEPIAGGKLAVKPPKEVQAIWDKANIKSTPAKLALQWVWNHPEVSVVLSGMSTLEQVMENLESADDSEPGVLTKEELDVINQIAQKYKESGYIGCTGCKYCMPCPQGVNIPEIIALYNEFYVRGRDDEVKKKYRENITPETNAKKCVKCGTCETLCPQQLPIRNILRGATFAFEQNA